MIQNVNCRCGEQHEIYDAYRECPYFHTQIEVASRKSGYEPMHLLSTGKWRSITVSDEELGLKP